MVLSIPIYYLREVIIMIEIAYSREKGILRNKPQEVQETIRGILQILDAEYGTNRNKYEDDGGYVIVVEKKEDFKEIKDKTYIDCNEVIAEYVDKIVCSNGEVYTNSLIICNNDYAISLIISIELTPKNLKDYMID
ncbi:MAG: hypothetical protein Q607_CBUC00041G0008 [Clostridium butyricum DORA_1]|nr:MAG: hypothetical protein Q607_CBUC00041G0008 [Clostridium butyricum DORA_1]